MWVPKAQAGRIKALCDDDDGRRGDGGGSGRDESVGNKGVLA